MKMKQLLKDIATIGAGQGAPQGDENYSNIGTPFVKAGNLQELLSGKNINDIQQVSEEVAKKHKLRLYPKGTLLFAKSGMSCMKGFVYVLPQEAYVVSHLACIIPNEDISEYLRFYFNFRKPNQLVKDAAYPSISLSDIGELEIDMKTAVERNEIVNQLECIEFIIALRKKELEQLEELIKARFVELFGDPIVNSMGWVEELIGNSCFVTKLAGFEYTQYIHYEDSGDVVMVKAQNVKNGKLNRKDLAYISNEVSDSLPRSQLAVGDVVMTYVGANIGDVAVIDDEYKYHLAPNVAKIRPNAKKYNSIYFMYMLMFLNAYIVGNSADTAKAALGMDRIRKLKVFVPPTELQEQFATFVEQVDKSKFVVQKALDEAQLLFNSLMQKYFG